jgi:hypothetical protein
MGLKNWEIWVLKPSQNDDATVENLAKRSPVTDRNLRGVIYKVVRTYRKTWTDRLRCGLEFREFRGYRSWLVHTAISCEGGRWEGRYMGGTTVYVEYRTGYVIVGESREKFPVWTRKPSILIDLTTMSSSEAKPPLKLLALGKVFFPPFHDACR